tara:strand:- start:1044 stop:1457 length:414 start_codon:yes stop_codon:yes gene_type:complete
MAFTPVTLNTSPAFTLVTLPFPSSSDATCDTTSGDATATMDSTSAISAEMNVSGTGIPVNTRVLSVTNSTTFEMTNNATASNTNTTLTFTGALWNGITLDTSTTWVLPGSWPDMTVNDWEDETRTWKQIGLLGKDSD